MAVSVVNYNIAKASDVYQIDYELLAYITDNQDNSDINVIKDNVNKIYNKYYKSIKRFVNNPNVNIMMHFNLLCTLIPSFVFKEEGIYGNYNGLSVGIYFGSEIIIKLEYKGISRNVRLFANGNVSQMSLKFDNEIYNPGLERIYQNFAVQYHSLDLYENYTYLDREVVGFESYRMECDCNGNVINEYKLDTTLLANELYIDEYGNQSFLRHHKVIFDDNNIVCGETVKRPKYALVLEKIPDDVEKNIFSLDYIEISEEEYNKLRIISNDEIENNLILNNVNNVLLKHSKRIM